MKNILYTLTTLLLSLTVAHGQTIAGIAGAIYVNIIPDTLLNPPLDSEQYYYIDINQDGTNDITIHAVYHVNVSPSYTWRDVAVSSSNSYTSFSLGSVDSVIWPSACTTWDIFTILKVYNTGDTIKYGDYVSSGYLGYFHSESYIYCGTFGTMNTEWVNKGDVFVGVKYQTTSDTSFGWIKVNITDEQNVLIKEFSLGSSLTGINSLDRNNFLSVYPNPFSTQTTLRTDKDLKDATLTVYNLYGQIVKEIKNISGQAITLHRDNLVGGLHFIRLTQDNKIISADKLVIADN